jgi:hypothetical protein
MSELQLGLLAIGVLLVVGVFAYNWRQESVARRAGAKRIAPGTRRRADAARAGSIELCTRRKAGRPCRNPGACPPATEALPDSRIDYVVELTFNTPITAGMLVQQWKASEHRYADRAILACDGGGAGWRRLSVDDMAAVDSLRAGLQLSHARRRRRATPS